MASEILVKQGTAVCWADTTDYSATNSGIARTHQIDLTSLASTKARQGAKADLGATRSAGYAVIVGIEMDVAPVAGTVVAVYWSPSYDSTAGTGNAGGASGADEAYKDGEESEWVQQLIHIGDVVMTADAATTVQVQCVNPYFMPPTRYGMPVVYNQNTLQAFEGDAVEMFVAFVPVTDESQ